MYLWRFLGWCCNHDDSLQHLSLSSAKATFCSDTYIHHMYVLIYVCSAKKYIWKKVNKFLIEFVYIILAMQTFGIVLIVCWRNKPKLNKNSNFKFLEILKYYNTKLYSKEGKIVGNIIVYTRYLIQMSRYLVYEFT